MIEVLDYIQDIYPNDWLLGLQQHFSDFNEAWVDIQHPDNTAIELRLVVTPDRVGIAILKVSESDIELDLGGFDYSFEKHEMNRLKECLSYFLKTANPEF